jgi:hypothetical protein
MQMALADTVARVLEPETPVVWLDPTLPSALWEALPAALEREGFRVAQLEDGATVAGAGELLSRLARISGEAGVEGYSAEEARRLLNWFRAAEGLGWVLVWRHPEAVRQENESRFEEFVDVLESLHEEGPGVAPKLIVAD